MQNSSKCHLISFFFVQPAKKSLAGWSLILIRGSPISKSRFIMAGVLSWLKKNQTERHILQCCIVQLISVLIWAAKDLAAKLSSTPLASSLSAVQIHYTVLRRIRIKRNVTLLMYLQCRCPIISLRILLFINFRFHFCPPIDAN